MTRSFPDTTIAAGGYLVVWLGVDSSRTTPVAARSQLDLDGEQIGLFDRVSWQTGFWTH